MSYVEVETGRYVKRWAFWNPATWSIPKLYWDAWSQEQRLHAICRQLEKVIKYADYLGVNVDDIAARLKAIEEGQLDDFIVAAIEAWFEEHEPEIWQSLTELHGTVDSIVAEIGTGFDADNTVKKAIDDINGAIDDINENGWVTPQRVSEAYTNEIEQKIRNATTAGSVLMPSYIGDIIMTVQNGCCCVNGTNAFMIGSNSYDEANGTVFIIDLEHNSWSSKSVSVGHANSAAFDTTRESVWVALYSTYTSGTGVASNVIRKFNPTFTTIDDYILPDRTFAVSFDSVTNTVYAMALPETNYFNIYKMEQDENDFSLFDSISKNEFPNVGTVSMQDMAVHNGLFYFSRPEGSFYVFEHDESGFVKIANGNITADDVNGCVHYGEVEGWEFDENGILYNCRNYYYGGSDNHYGVNDGSLTILTTEFGSKTATMYDQRTGASSYLIPNNSKFALGRGELKSLRQVANWPCHGQTTITVDTGISVDEIGNQVISIGGKNVCLRVRGTYQNNGIFVYGGSVLGIIVTGQYIFNANSTNNYVIDSTHTTNMISIRCEGTGTITLGKTPNAFIWNGYGNTVTFVGTLNGVSNIKIGGTTVPPMSIVMRNSIMATL